VSFATVTLRVASQRAFIVVHVTCDPQFYNGWKNAFASSFASNSGKLHWKCRKCSKQLLVTMPMEEYGYLSGSLNSNVGKLQLKIVSVQVVPPYITHTKCGESLQNHQTNHETFQ
jgi:hypothetical protein